jgi:hypothetical protein
MAYDFRAWLNVQPDDKEYDFMNCTGNCAMGQYMKSIGEKWDMVRYNEHVNKEFRDIRPLSGSKTFGELKKAMV